MNGYQPKNTCENCASFSNCLKGKISKDACKQYVGKQPKPPKSGSLVMTPQGITYTPPQKQRTVLSVRDFVILYEIASRELGEIEKKILCMGVDREETKHYPYYQDLLRIRDKLGELNIDVETPIVEVE